jgi:hypothetical protein
LAKTTYQILAEMKLRFCIRDLLWLTALVAVLVSYWIDHRRTAQEHEAQLRAVRKLLEKEREEVRTLRGDLYELKRRLDELLNTGK